MYKECKMFFPDCISKVIITEQFDERYMNIFKKYNKSIYANLIQEFNGKKKKVTKTALTKT